MTDPVRHLAQQVVCWTGWALGHTDVARPWFHRQNDLVTQWGGPNADNLYRHARVDPRGRYRIEGRMHSCEEFLLAVRAGNMHMPENGTLHEVSATDLGIGEGADFSFTLGRGGDVPLPDGARMIAVREYYFDWRPLEPAVLTIERLDPPAASPPPSTLEALGEAIGQVTRSVVFWDEYMVRARAALTDNSFGDTRLEPKGLQALAYAHAFWRLSPGEALVVEVDRPGARYWSFQLYELGTFEALDIVDRVTSLNHTQVAVDDDGRVRVVLAAEDAGVANWLDTEGRPEGLVTFRCAWAETTPNPSARVVPVAALDDELPAGTARLDPDGRAAQVARRRAHLKWRFRP